jgi:hypothetical protein
MQITVALDWEDGDRTDALYLLHFPNGVRVDLDAENHTVTLPMSYFEGRYVTPAGDVEPHTYRSFTEGSVDQGRTGTDGRKDETLAAGPQSFPFPSSGDHPAAAAQAQSLPAAGEAAGGDPGPGGGESNASGQAP